MNPPVDSSNMNCPYQLECSGCSLLDIPYSQHEEIKTRHFRQLLEFIDMPKIEWISFGPFAQRDRVDFQLQNGKLGLFIKDSREILDLDHCPQLSGPLQSWLNEFRRALPPINKATFRLRVAPDGKKGLWVDTANLNIKTLLEQKNWLVNLLDKDIIIEMGQKRKLVVLRGEQLKLKEPQPYPWFKTQWKDLTVPLYGSVGSFTQPSLTTHVAFSHWITKQIQQIQPRQVFEVGCGQGHLSFPALSEKIQLTAIDNDRDALRGFEQSLSYLDQLGFSLQDQVHLIHGNFETAGLEHLQFADLLMANPPRSGLGQLMNLIEMESRLRSIIYISCQPTSFAKDAQKLAQLGFHLQNSTLLDQFPQTPHYEILSYWQR